MRNDNAEGGGRGLVIVYTGNGKGKTTAALGLALRAWGWDKKVVILQFIKATASNCGEHRAARRIGIEISAKGSGRTERCKDLERARTLALEQWKTARERICSGTDDVVVLDEISYPLRNGWVPLEELLQMLKERPRHIHVALTGRGMPEEVIAAADLATEMVEIKHPLRTGIRAQKGIEF